MEVRQTLGECELLSNPRSEAEKEKGVDTCCCAPLILHGCSRGADAAAKMPTRARCVAGTSLGIKTLSLLLGDTAGAGAALVPGGSSPWWSHSWVGRRWGRVCPLLGAAPVLAASLCPFQGCWEAQRAATGATTMQGMCAGLCHLGLA